jgi:hypothetical protein
MYLDGTIEGDMRQGQTGDCWLLSSIQAIRTNPETAESLNDCISIDNDGNAVVNLRGAGTTYTITQQEIADSLALSQGDPDIRAIEIAMDRHCKENPNWMDRLKSTVIGGLVDRFLPTSGTSQGASRDQPVDNPVEPGENNTTRTGPDISVEIPSTPTVYQPGDPANARIIDTSGLVRDVERIINSNSTDDAKLEELLEKIQDARTERELVAISSVFGTLDDRGFNDMLLSALEGPIATKKSQLDAQKQFGYPVQVALSGLEPTQSYSKVQLTQLILQIDDPAITSHDTTQEKLKAAETIVELIYRELGKNIDTETIDGSSLTNFSLLKSVNSNCQTGFIEGVVLEPITDEKIESIRYNLNVQLKDHDSNGTLEMDDALDETQARRIAGAKTLREFQDIIAGYKRTFSRGSQAILIAIDKNKGLPEFIKKANPTQLEIYRRCPALCTLQNLLPNRINALPLNDKLDLFNALKEFISTTDMDLTPVKAPLAELFGNNNFTTTNAQQTRAVYVDNLGTIRNACRKGSAYQMDIQKLKDAMGLSNASIKQ